MLFLDLTLPSPAENLALDEALLLEAEQHGGEVLRLWEWPTPLVVLGAAGKLGDDVGVASCCRDRVPILRRVSGGGTVLLNRGCLIYSLVLAYQREPALREVRSSYVFILDRIRQSVARLVPDIDLAGTSDLAWRGSKISGNSQQRKRRHLLHHGTILYDFEVGLMERYLKMPARQPDYRRQRAHAEFVANLPVAAADLKDRLRATWQAEQAATSWPEDQVRRLVEDKYSREEWARRR